VSWLGCKATVTASTAGLQSNMAEAMATELPNGAELAGMRMSVLRDMIRRWVVSNINQAEIEFWNKHISNESVVGESGGCL
jgi:hypothetical protein